jgi:SP family general alpha glucoside:H+ symporter-like MFS transporter
MESYCVFLMGAFVAMDAFKKEYGVLDKDGVYQIEASWQSALQMGGPLGAIIGVCLAGPITSRIGYRWATISGLMLLNAFIFVFYFANSLAVMFVSQLLEGIPWGIFIANAPAYCSEIVPIQLRAPATQMLQMFWAIGAIIVGGVCYVYEANPGSVAYRLVLFLRVTSKSRLLTRRKFQDPYCAPMDVPHSACRPPLSGSRVALVAGSKGTSR